VVTAPTPHTSTSMLIDFHPGWSAYQAIVMNRDAPGVRWPDSLQQSFETSMHNRGGLVTVHVPTAMAAAGRLGSPRGSPGRKN